MAINDPLHADEMLNLFVEPKHRTKSKWPGRSPPAGGWLAWLARPNIKSGLTDPSHERSRTEEEYKKRGFSRIPKNKPIVTGLPAPPHGAPLCNGVPYANTRQVCCDGNLHRRGDLYHGSLVKHRVSGTYDADWGPIKCDPPKKGWFQVECKYGHKGKWSLHLRFENKEVRFGRNNALHSTMPDGKLVGHWDHNDGKTGPAEFNVNYCGEITGGKYGHKPNPANKLWTVHKKISK